MRVHVFAIGFIGCLVAVNVSAGDGTQQIVSPFQATTAAATAAPIGVVRVSVGTGGTQSNRISTGAVISSDGRFVVFESDATNLVADDTNAVRDVFVHDRSTGLTTRESISSGRAEANAGCTSPRISTDGRFVTFLSRATNLVSGVSGLQLFVRDRQLGLTTIASASPDGTAANDSVIDHALSADGRFMTFSTAATNLASGTQRFITQIYTRDSTTGVTRLVSVSPTGVPGDNSSLSPSMSADGRYVVYQSTARNLAPVFSVTSRVLLYDRSTGETTSLSIGPAGEGLIDATQPSISGDGRFVAFAARLNSNSTYNFYLRDRETAQTTVVLQNSGTGVVRLNSDGRLASYNRNYNNVNYVEVYDRTTGQITTLAPGFLYSAVGGNALPFDSGSPLVAGDTNGAFDVFVTPVGADPDAPNPPTNLAYSLAASRLTLTWSAPAAGSAPSSYLLEAGTQSHSTDAANFLNASTETQFSTPFASSGTFYVRVRAVNSAGVSVPSNEIILAPLTVPGAPTNLAASVGDVGVRLTWSPAAGAVASYIIEAGSAPGGTDLANFNTGSANTTFTATGVPGGTYYVRVRGAGGGGVGPASNEVSFTVAGGCPVPAVPTGLTRSVIGSSVTLSWTAAAAASSYVLEAGSATGRADLVTLDLNSSATTFVAFGVPAGTYFVRVRSKNGCGQSGPSNEAVVIVVPGS